MRRYRALPLLMAWAIWPGPVTAADSNADLAAVDVEAGRKTAETCSACHGSSGVSVNDLWPNLAGQKAGYLAGQLRAFRDGTRKDPIMATFAKALSDADIRNLAAHYSRLPISGAVERSDWYRQRQEQKSY